VADDFETTDDATSASGSNGGAGMPTPARMANRVQEAGQAEVDAVLESLSGLDEAPVSEHVAVFESAHERLRAALADAGNDRY
jgi:hypothetical protein